MDKKEEILKKHVREAQVKAGYKEVESFEEAFEGKDGKMVLGALYAAMEEYAQSFQSVTPEVGEAGRRWSSRTH